MSIKINDEKMWKFIANFVMCLFSALAILPVILLFIASFTDNEWALANGFSYFPGKWSLAAYQYISGSIATIAHAYVMTILVTLIGTVLGIILTAMFAYTLSYEELPGIRILNFLVVLTMLFSGGIVASFYVWARVIKIRDTIWALIIPNLLMNGFNIILVKNYFKTSIPQSLLEAARIDGCGEFRIFWKIVFPLSKPIIATIGLMSGIMYWNDWTNGLYYLTQRNGSKFYTIQLILNQINSSVSYLASTASNSMVTGSASLPTTTARMAIAVVGIIPIIAAYPFFQQYFTRGITMGAVKE